MNEYMNAMIERAPKTGETVNFRRSPMGAQKLKTHRHAWETRKRTVSKCVESVWQWATDAPSPTKSDYKRESERDDKTEAKLLYVRMLQSRPPKPGMHLHTLSHLSPVLSFWPLQ